MDSSRGGRSSHNDLRLLSFPPVICETPALWTPGPVPENLAEVIAAREKKVLKLEQVCV